jgi:hypothetical protein
MCMFPLGKYQIVLYHGIIHFLFGACGIIVLLKVCLGLRVYGDAAVSSFKHHQANTLLTEFAFSWKVRPRTFQPLRLRPLRGCAPAVLRLAWCETFSIRVDPSEPARFFIVSSFSMLRANSVSKFLLWVFEQILALSKFDFREQFFFTVSKFSSIWAICV